MTEESEARDLLKTEHQIHKQHCISPPHMPSKGTPPYSYMRDQCGTVDTVQGGGPSSLSEKFSNGTSTIDFDDKCLDAPDSDDEAENHLPKVLTSFLSIMV
ncbi:Uncharacterized protein Fot_35530 [Forsythia ovata]|uniref:Uncharacterized protein n=1 Tax=Forsythia ovata TaxID=205694 RepID=A0ABD1SPT6_9LAMI